VSPYEGYEIYEYQSDQYEEDKAKVAQADEQHRRNITGDTKAVRKQET